MLCYGAAVCRSRVRWSTAVRWEWSTPGLEGEVGAVYSRC